MRQMDNEPNIEILDGLFDRGCRVWLRPETEQIVNQNYEKWRKMYWVGMVTGENLPQFSVEWEQHEDNKWLIPQLAYWFECSESDDEKWYMERARLTMQIFSLGIYAALVTAKNMDVYPILDLDIAQDPEEASLDIELDKYDID